MEEARRRTGFVRFRVVFRWVAGLRAAIVRFRFDDDFKAAFWRRVPKCRICLAVIFRRPDLDALRRLVAPAAFLRGLLTRVIRVTTAIGWSLLSKNQDQIRISQSARGYRPIEWGRLMVTWICGDAFPDPVEASLVSTTVLAAIVVTAHADNAVSA